MTAVLVGDDEWALFAGEPAELLKLYVALKRRMDFATGIAGQKTLINEIVLREGFTVDPIPGRPKPKPITREQYRSAIRRMEKLGALKVIGPLVFEFPHARRDQSAKNSYNRATTELQPEQQPKAEQAKPSNGAGLSDSDSGATTGLFFEQMPSCNLLQESGKSNTPPPRAHDFDARTKFAMHPAWEPDAKAFQATLTMNGLAGISPSIAALNEFKSFWTASPDEHRTQARWEHALAQHLKREHRNEQANGRSAKAEANQNSSSGVRSGRKRSLSAPDRVRLAIEQNRAERAKACGAASNGTAGEAVGNHVGDLRPPLDVEFWREPEA